MQTGAIKQQTCRLLEKLPDKATWDDLMNQIYVRQSIPRLHAIALIIR